ncbi:MAG: transposase, partial [Cyanobacteria bacterium P01_D01_bin.1]
VQGVQTLIESAQATLIYLPPYSPDFSPIENFWSKVKQHIRSTAARTYKTLDEAITQAIDAVSLTDIEHWFAHCCYCTSLN